MIIQRLDESQLVRGRRAVRQVHLGGRVGREELEEGRLADLGHLPLDGGEGRADERLLLRLELVLHLGEAAREEVGEDGEEVQPDLVDAALAEVGGEVAHRAADEVRAEEFQLTALKKYR